MSLSRRLVALVLALLAAGGSGPICAGWLPTAEARMACCVEGQECPMHHKESGGDTSSGAVSQAEADTCCALSEERQSGRDVPSAPVIVSAAVLGAGIVVRPVTPRPVRAEWLRPGSPGPSPPIHTHVLHSVFLI